MVKGRQEARASLMPILCHRFTGYRRDILVSRSCSPSSPAPPLRGQQQAAGREQLLSLGAIISKVMNVPPNTNMRTMSWNQEREYIACFSLTRACYFCYLLYRKIAVFAETSEMSKSKILCPICTLVLTNEPRRVGAWGWQLHPGACGKEARPWVAQPADLGWRSECGMQQEDRQFPGAESSQWTNVEIRP